MDCVLLEINQRAVSIRRSGVQVYVFIYIFIVYIHLCIYIYLYISVCMHAQERALENSSKNLHFYQTQTSLPETAGSTSAERLHKFKLKLYVICSVKCHSLFNPTSSVLGVYAFIHLVLLKIIQGGQKNPLFFFHCSVWGRAVQGCMVVSA